MLKRDLGALGGVEFDLLVIGAGIAGAVAAWDAALRGLTVVLVERADLGGGASANSLKLLHGGLRYVRRLELRAAREAVRERRAWQRIAPHLVAPMPVLVPSYGNSIQNRWTLRALLAASDAVAWDRNRGLDADQFLAGGRMLSRSEVLDRAARLDCLPVTGGALFHDARLRSSERLLLDVVRAASHAGAVVANYVELESGVLRDGRIRGAWVRDRIGGTRFEVRARAIVNAAGGASAEVLRRLLGHTPATSPRSSLAFNLVVPGRDLSIVLALGSRPAGHWSTGRQLLRVPWLDREVLGTAHVPVRNATEPLRVAESDAAAFLAEHDAACPGMRTRLDDIIGVQAGLLPLEPGTAETAVRLLRRHRIMDHNDAGASGVFSLVSVKYTTARLAAECAIDAVVRNMGRRFARCGTATTTLPSAGVPTDTLEETAFIRHGRAVPEDVLRHLVRNYGVRYERILAYRTERRDGEARVHPDSPVTVAELVHGVREEMALCAADLVWRRTDLGARGLAGSDVLAHAAAIAESVLGPASCNVPATHPE
jgi:glycerol-3-phosphate dehydrogenase